MTLLTFDNISLDFGDQLILKEASFSLLEGERVCLIGRNGAGKSTLLKIISGEQTYDRGVLKRRNGLRVAKLAQALPESLDRTVADFVGEGLTEVLGHIAAWRALAENHPDAVGLRRLEALQRQIDAHGGWGVEQQVATVLSELDLPPERRLGELSGGWQRRAALAQALVSSPDVLLLDEPTNHLDLSTIIWLEQKVLSFQGSVLFITHDRAFLQRLATRIVEIDRGNLTDWPGNYQTYLTNKAKALEDEARHHDLFDKKLELEEAWIRQGVKARRTRNEGRVRALHALREVAEGRIKPLAAPRIQVEEAEQSSRKVVEIRNVAHGFGGPPVIKGVSLKIMRGERIGLVGNNGVGKSTLLKILLGEIEPDSGSVKLGLNLEVGYFDQMRRDLDPNKTVADIVGDGRDQVLIDGQERHIIGYLKGFLFSAERAKTPIRALSGGECNRVILARLFTRPSNLLVLDEPTNDLDVETLDVLEARLQDYSGSLIVVSHDRAFMDNVVSSVLVFEDNGQVEQYPGGYSDWLVRGRKLAETDNPNRTKARPAAAAPATRPAAAAPATRPSAPREPPAGKLSFKLKFELAQLPTTIEALETEVAALTSQTNASGFYQRPHLETQATLATLAARQAALDEHYARWATLEALQTGSG
ncbi:MAG: ATP-binding cassette domain-containing protein [Gammaproteobacteria bacterium]|nr:ATP-binding cassette domain-containing protein [Gammaproteobacteria bacterium]